MNFFFSAINGSPDASVRNVLWNDLHNIANNIDLRWVAVGDFNAIMYASEKLGEERPW